MVANSPAADAKLQPGDVIKKFNGREIHSFPELRSLVGQAELDKKVDLEIERDGKRMTVSTEIKERPADYASSGVVPRRQRPLPPQQSPQQPDENDTETEAGLASVQVTDLTPDLAERLDVPPGIHGVVVTDAPENLADLRKGDVIEEVNQQPVTSAADFKKLAGSLDPDQTTLLAICRHRTRSVVILRAR